MLRLSLTLAALTLLSSTAFANEIHVSPCIDALEQVTALETWAPAYKLEGTDSRHYLDDADRAAELARLKKVIKSACSTSAKGRQSDEALLGKPPRLVELRTVLTELTQQPAPAALPVLRQRVL
jgi:hypothetical protein